MNNLILDKTDRRSFLADLGGLALGSICGGCLSAVDGRIAQHPTGPVWGALLHLGSNMWTDWTPDGVYPKSQEEEARMVREGKIKYGKSLLYVNRDYMSADWPVWRDQVNLVRDEGLNAVMIDIGEAFAYPSHPELWVEGSLTPEKLGDELAYLRAQGLEPIPKLNFSAGHDQWLREYHYQTSSRKYYEVVADLIRDVCEVFGSPRYFHIGFDEEIYANARDRAQVVLRQGDLWWKSFLFCVGEVERHGARPMLWSDKICSGRDEFLKRMPKSVLQVPWYYGDDFSDENTHWRAKFEKDLTWDVHKNLAASIVELAEAGFDVLPCTSNWKSPKAADAMLAFCRKRLDPARVKGYLTAPWRKPVAAENEIAKAGIRQLAEAKRRYFN